MKEVDNTISELKIIEVAANVLRARFDESLKYFLIKFSTEGSLKKVDDNISLELQETFFRLMDARESLENFEELMKNSWVSLTFVKENAPPRIDAGFFVTRKNLHEFLYDSVELGKEDEWFLLFENPPKDMDHTVYYMDGRMLSRVSVHTIMNKSHEELKNKLGEYDLFGVYSWVEKNARFIEMSDGKLIKVVDE